MCHHCRMEMSGPSNQQQQSHHHYQHYHQRSSPKSFPHHQQQQHRSRTPPHHHSHQFSNRPVVGYSPPAKQLAGGRMHEPPRPEDLPVPPTDWCGALEQRQRHEQEQQLVQARLLQVQCDMASQMLKRMLNVSA